MILPPIFKQDMCLFQGIIKDGGTNAGVIPSVTTMEVILRAPEEEQLTELARKVIPCFQSAADVTGCSMDVVTKHSVKNFMPNNTMAKVYREFAESFGEYFLTYRQILYLKGAMSNSTC